MESFLDRFKRCRGATPSPIHLGVGRDNNFYWIYYAGMGSYSYHKVSKETSLEIKDLMRYDRLDISDEYIFVDVYAADLDRMIRIKFNRLVLNDL